MDQPDINTGFLPVDGRWHYNRFLTFRPGPGLPVSVNPPRFSWPYVPEVIPTSPTPLTDFLLEIDAIGDFSKPEVSVVTPFNFYNALGPFPPGSWHWRVTYGHGKPGAVVSDIRTFVVAPGTPEWDRRVISKIGEILTSRSRPRTLGTSGWEGFRQALKAADPGRIQRLLSDARKAMESPWYSDFPITDFFSGDVLSKMTRTQRLAFVDVADGLLAIMLAHKITGEASYRGGIERILRLAAFPKGGLSSPEFHGSSIKFTTRVTAVLGLAYDWYHGDLTPSEKEILSQSLDWRIRAWFTERGGWARGEFIDPAGLGVAADSHPYQGSLWLLPALFSRAGEEGVADHALAMMTHYLCGVTATVGPDEGWNEGEWYGFEKPQTLLDEVGWYRVILPELSMEKNPVLWALPDWHAQMVRLGQTRFPFGDTHEVARQWGMAWQSAKSAYDLTGARRFLDRAQAWTSWLTAVAKGEGEEVLRGHAKTALEVIGRETLNIPALLLGGRSEPEDNPERRRPEAEIRIYPEAGWVFAGNMPPSRMENPKSGFSVAFICRSRGGYSHSYRAENSFSWQAFGEMLLAGASGNRITDASARSTMMHQGILVDGVGQEYDENRPTTPFYGRVLYFRSDTWGAAWTGDATRAYPNVQGLKRVHRHMVFLNQGAVVLFDDLAFSGREGIFSMVCHTGDVSGDSKLSWNRGLGFEWTQGSVTGSLRAGPGASISRALVRTGEALWRNEHTGEDLFPQVKEAVDKRQKRGTLGSGYGPVILEDRFQTQSLWVDMPKGERVQLLWVLTAQPRGEDTMPVEFSGKATVTVGNGDPVSVSFGEEPGADIFMDLEKIRSHAENP